jgi:uncharacterized protein (UPF0332 family)
MSLQDWQNHGWLRIHKTTPKEIEELFNIVDRDLKAAQTQELNPDWQYGIAYNAALKLCTILLYTEGYRSENNNAHYRTIDAMPYILGPKRKTDGDYLNACRGIRNTLEYERTNEVNQDDVNELVEFVKELKQDVIDYLKVKHPKILK